MMEAVKQGDICKPEYSGGVSPNVYIKPRRFTPEEISILVDQYIADRMDAKLPISRVGLSVYINNTTGKHINADTITDYDKLDVYHEHIKRLDDASYVFTVDCMFTKQNPAGPIFFAKNVHGMADKQEINVNESITIQIGDIPGLEAIQARLAERLKDVTPTALALDSGDVEAVDES